MLQDHERHAGVARGVGDGHEFRRSLEVFRRELYACVPWLRTVLTRSRTRASTPRPGMLRTDPAGCDSSGRRLRDCAVPYAAARRARAFAWHGGSAGRGLSVTPALGGGVVDCTAHLFCTVGPIATPSATAPTNLAARADALPTVIDNLLWLAPRSRPAWRGHTAELFRATRFAPGDMEVQTAWCDFRPSVRLMGVSRQPPGV